MNPKEQRVFPKGQRLNEEDFRSLTGVMAHEIRNTLTPILTLISLQRESTSNPKLKEQLETLEESVRRGVGVVKKLLFLSKGTLPGKNVVFVDQLLQTLEKNLQAVASDSIDLQFPSPPIDQEVTGDLDLLYHALDNLCLNAIEAMPEGGTLKVEIIEDTDEAFTIEISDTGKGIEADLLNKIWTPFFSTKSEQSSSGLGLTVAREIISSHRGEISLTSEASGSGFYVTLPKM